MSRVDQDELVGKDLAPVGYAYKIEDAEGMQDALDDAGVTFTVEVQEYIHQGILPGRRSGLLFLSLFEEGEKARAALLAGGFEQQTLREEDLLDEE